MAKRTFINEADVKAAIKKVFKKYDVFYWMPAANGYGVSGVSDFCALHGHRFIALETKFGTRKPTENQKQYLHRVYECGGIALVVSDRTLDDFLQWFELHIGGFDAPPPLSLTEPFDA